MDYLEDYLAKNNTPLFNHIDLRGTPCPLNYIRCNLAIEQLQKNQFLKVDIDRGEPEETVISGLLKEGHKVDVVNKTLDYLTFVVDNFEI